MSFMRSNTASRITSFDDFFASTEISWVAEGFMFTLISVSSPLVVSLLS